MAYHVPKHLAHCRVQGRTAFLDIARNRYFQLPPDLDTAFQIVVDERHDADHNVSAVDRLIRLGLIEAGSAPRGRSIIEPPVESLRDSEGRTQADLASSLGAMAAVLRAARRLRVWSFERLVGWVSARSHASQTFCDLVRTGQLIGHFETVRPFAPVEPRCLVDSLALIDFLARRDLYPNLVFGVSLEPFSAHCWLQSGRIVLNDSLDNALGHTPILVL